MTMKTGWIVMPAVLISLFSFTDRDATGADYPTKPISVIVGFAPGGGTDLGARVICEKAKGYLGQEFVVTNKPGGTTQTAATIISKVKPDGYTIGATTTGLYLMRHLFEKLPFDWTDFTYISQYGALEFGVLVRDDSPFRDFKDFIQYARANPEKLTVATTGLEGLDTLALLVAARQEGVKVKIVPFSGAADAMVALMGGHVMAAELGASGWASHHRAKKTRTLVMLTDIRSEFYPEVPCFKEMNYPFTATSNYMFVAPKNLDKAIRDKLADAFIKATETSEYITLAKSLGIWTRTPLLYTDKLTEAIGKKRSQVVQLFKELGVGRIKE
jgi:tripartite-type tricarboxylate transporter receptor subunit TctC